MTPPTTQYRELERIVQSGGHRYLVPHVEVSVYHHGRVWRTCWSVSKWGRREAWRRCRRSARAYAAQALTVKPRPRRRAPLARVTCEECGVRFPTRHPRLARTCSDACRYRRWYWRHREAAGAW